MLFRRLIAACLISMLCLAIFFSHASTVAAASPTISVSGYPAPGNTLFVNGAGFPAGDAVSISYDTTQLAMTRSSWMGIVGGNTVFLAVITLPTATTTGTHTIVANDASAGLSAQVSISVMANWPQLGYSPSGTRANPYETAISAANVSQLSPAWSLITMTGGGLNPQNTLTIADGRMFMGGGSSGPLKAYSVDTQQLLWSTNAEVWTDPAVSGNLMYVSANGLVALSATTGQVLWISGDESYTIDSPVAANGLVYVTVNSRGLYAYAANGCGEFRCNAVWTRFPATNYIFLGTPAVAYNHVYAAATDGKLYALNAANGNISWTGTTISGRAASAVVVDGNYVIVNIGNSSPITEDSEIFVFNVGGCGQTTCAPLWTGVDRAADGTPPAVAHGTIYIGSEDGHLYAFNESGCGNPTCAPEWEGDAGGLIKSPAAVANGVVYISSQGAGTFLAFSATGCGSSSCTPLWTYSVPSYHGEYEAPVVVNGIAYFINEEPWNVIFAFHLPTSSVCHLHICGAARLRPR